MGKGRDDIRRKNAEEAETALGEARATALKPDAQRMGRIQWTGTWLSVPPSTVTGTELGTQEWRDSLFLCYDIKPTIFISHCYGCWAAFTIFHALDCKKGGLIMGRHNEFCDGVDELSGKAFNPVHVSNNPKIFTSCAVQGGKTKAKGKSAANGREALPPEEGEEKGDLLI